MVATGVASRILVVAERVPSAAVRDLRRRALRAGVVIEVVDGAAGSTVLVRAGPLVLEDPPGRAQ